MCAPMYIKSEEVMYEGILQYAREYKRLEGKSKVEIEHEMADFEKAPMTTLKALQQLIAEVRENIEMVYTPTFVVQARHDAMINTDSANIIFNNIETDFKELKWYEESGHVITLDKEREQLYEDIFQFLEKLAWEE